ncbi:hypothetical protein [Desulfocastanea catecholica]
MRRGKLFAAFIVFECVALLVLCLHGSVGRLSGRTLELQAKRALVSRLGLTDPAIWTEARYTRHPSQTDFFTAFQDFPGSPDHFPAGSLIAPVQQIFSGGTE